MMGGDWRGTLTDYTGDLVKFISKMPSALIVSLFSLSWETVTHYFPLSHVYDLAFLASSLAETADREEGLVGG